MTEQKKKEETGVDIAKKTMTGDLRDQILQIVQTMQKPWQQLSEGEQTLLVNNVDQRVGHIVSKVVDIISADGRKTIIGNLVSITVKDGFKATISLPKDSELSHDLIDAQGSLVALVVADREVYKGEQSPAKIDKDQKELPVDDGKPVADAGKNIPQATKVDRGAVRR